MARITTAKCRLCRREGDKLFLKGERCSSPKCAIVKRNFPPGMQGSAPSHRRGSEFGRQLREKQKMKRIYGVMEKQFRRYFSKADTMDGVTGENLIRLLETRVDNVVLRLGLATSLAQARQLVNHGLILVNGKRVSTPSYTVKKDDKISFSKSAMNSNYVSNLQKVIAGRLVPAWLALDVKTLNGEVKGMPARVDLGFTVDTQLIVEFYSK